MSDEISPQLRADIDAFLIRKPGGRALIDKLLRKRADGTEDPAVIDNFIRTLMEPPRRHGWWIGVAVLALVGGVVLYNVWQQRAHEAALAASAPAVALVKRMDSGDCLTTPRGARCLRLELEVHREGHAPYTASLNQIIDLEWISRVQPGEWLTIGVDRDEPTTLYFDEAAMAVAAPAPPAG